MKTYLRRDQIEKIEDEKRAIQETLSTRWSQDRPSMSARYRQLDKMLEEQAPPDTTPLERDKLDRRRSELEEFIREGMPTDQEMRRGPAGAVGAHQRWESGDASRVGHKTRKEAILDWKNIMRRLEPQSRDPDVANVERLRRRDGGQLNMIHPMVPGKDYFVPSDAQRANHDRIFGTDLEAHLARLTEQVAFLERQLQARQAGEPDGGPVEIEKALAQERKALEKAQKVQEYETAPCGKQVKKNGVRAHQWHCKTPGCGTRLEELASPEPETLGLSQEPAP